MSYIYTSTLNDTVNALDYFPAGFTRNVANDDVYINAALATGKNVRLPKGSYHVSNTIFVNPGQEFYGDGKGQTLIKAFGDFYANANAIINLTGREQNAPTVRDLRITFDQPSAQTSRSNFQTLANGGTNITGVQYPPAINIGNSNRFRLRNLEISQAWNGIVNNPGNSTGGFMIENIEISAYNIGLYLFSVFDFCHVRGIHFWDFDIGTTTYNNVFKDGNTFCMIIGVEGNPGGLSGEVDGINFVDICAFNGRIAHDHHNSWSHFTNLMLDGGATFEIYNNQWLQLENVYFTGSPLGNSTIAAGIYQSAGNQTIITNLFTQPGTSVPSANGIQASIYVNGGSMLVSSGRILVSTPGIAGIQIANGSTVMLDTLRFQINTAGGAWTVPIVNSVGSVLKMRNCWFNQALSSNSTSNVALLMNDSPQNMITNNHWNGWYFSPPGNSGVYYPNGPDALTIKNAANAWTSACTFPNTLTTSNTVSVNTTNISTSFFIIGNNAGDTNQGSQFQMKNLAANPKSKYFRISTGGIYQILNDAYTSTLFALKDDGNTTFTGAVNINSANTSNISGTIAALGGQWATSIGVIQPSVNIANSLAIGTSQYSMGGAAQTLRVVSANTSNGQFGGLALYAPGSAQDETTGISFYPTFHGTGDNGPRRAADISAGFSNGTWNNEYLTIGVGSLGQSNDAANVTHEQIRFATQGITVSKEMTFAANLNVTFSQIGVGAPTSTNHSPGAKIILSPAIGPTQTDYAIGIGSNQIWTSVPGAPGSSYTVSWYANTTPFANLYSNGTFSSANVTVAGNVTVKQAIIPSTVMITATGNTQANATIVSSDVTIVTNCGTGNGVTLNGQVNQQQLLLNRSANSINIWPPVNVQIESFGANNSVWINPGVQIKVLQANSTQIYIIQ